MQSTVIVGLVLGLGPRDGEGGFVSRDGSGELIGDPRVVAACAVDKSSGSLAWCLLVPTVVVTDSDRPRAEATGEGDCPSWRH